MDRAVFISYARKDHDFAYRLVADLRADGVVVWIDSVNIKTGETWDEAIERAITRCSDILVVLSPDAVSSRMVMNEIQYALERGKRVLPVLFRDCPMPLQLGLTQYADFTGSYADGLVMVKEALATVPPEREMPTRIPAAVPAQPSPADVPKQSTAASGLGCRFIAAAGVVLLTFLSLYIANRIGWDRDWRAVVVVIAIPVSIVAAYVAVRKSKEGA